MFHGSGHIRRPVMSPAAEMIYLIVDVLSSGNVNKVAGELWGAFDTDQDKT